MPVWAPSDHATLPSTRVPVINSTWMGSWLDEPERPFKHEAAQRMVDYLRALKAAAAMNEGVGLDGCAGEPATCGHLGWRLHGVARIEWSGMRGLQNNNAICVIGPWSPRPSSVPKWMDFAAM
jgi:hypothetical protein